MKYVYEKTSRIHWGRLYKKNTEITKELNITPVLDKIKEYRRNWLQNVNKMSRNTLPKILNNYTTTGGRN
jgi:hypothetical protein